MSEELKGKVAVVTGGSNGIGAAAAQMLAAAGASVVVGYNKGLDRAQKVVDALPGKGHRAQQVVLEDSATMKKAADEVRAAYGRCDVLINSAGFTQPVPHANLEGLTDALMDSVLIANVRGPFATIRAFGSHTCATTMSGEAFCWGYNLDGQLGDGTRTHRSRPVYVQRPSAP